MNGWRGADSTSAPHDQRIKKAIPGKDGFMGLRESTISGLWDEMALHFGKEWAKF
jgi:hypothetical protein